MAIPTGLGTTITIPTAGSTFDELAAFLNANPSFGTAFETVLKINATVSFQTGARLSKGASKRNTIIFDATSSRFRMISQSFTQTNKGILDFGKEGYLILEGRGYIGGGQSQFQIGIEAEILSFIDSHRTSQSDIAFRSNNTISSFNISDTFNFTFNNSSTTSFGLLIDSSLVNIPKNINFIVGDNATSPTTPILNAPNDSVFPSITFPPLANKTKYDVFYHRNNFGYGTITFDRPTFDLDLPIRFLTWGGGTTFVDSPQFASGFTSLIEVEASALATQDTVIQIRYNFSAPEYDVVGGFSFGVVDNQGIQINSLSSTIGDAKIIWQQGVGVDGGAKSALSKRTNVNLRLRKKGYQELNLSYAEYNEDVSFFAPPVLDGNYDPVIDGATVTGVSIGAADVTVTETRTIQEIYNFISHYLSENLNVENFAAIIDGALVLTNGYIIQTSGSGQILGSAFDDTKDSSLVETNGAVFTVYSTEADRDARTNPVVSNVSQYNFLFSALPATPVYLWVNSGNTELPTQVTLTQGVNTFDLGTAGVLNTLSNLIQYIPSKMYVDVTVINNGTGTEVSPFNNVQSALDNADILGTRTIVLMADTSIVQILEGFKIEGTPKNSLVSLNGQLVANTTFSGLKLTGTLGVGSKFNADKCTLIDVNGLNGTYTKCFIENTLTPAANSKVNMVDITSAEPADERPTLDFANNINVSFVLRDYKGGLNLLNVTDSNDNMTVSGTECKITIDSTCTAGNISIRGIAQLTDNSNGSTVDTTALNNPEQIGIALSSIISSVDTLSFDDTAILAAITALNDIDLTTIESSTVLAKTSDITGLTIPQLVDILATIKPDLTIINNNIKDASLIVPADRDLTI